MNIPTGYCQVNHFFSGTSLPRSAQVTYGLKLLGAPDTPDPEDLAADTHQEWYDRWKNRMPTTCDLVKTRVKYGPTDSGPFAEFTATLTGLSAQPPDSPQVAVLVTKQTALGGRSNRGRWFLPFLPEVSTNSGGVLAAADQAAYQAAADAWLTGVDILDGVDKVVLLHNAEEQAPTEITALVVNNQVATQRRRLRRVGGRRRIL